MLRGKELLDAPVLPGDGAAKRHAGKESRRRLRRDRRGLASGWTVTRAA
jgi:hypothetical protein